MEQQTVRGGKTNSAAEPLLAAVTVDLAHSHVAWVVSGTWWARPFEKRGDWSATSATMHVGGPSPILASIRAIGGTADATSATKLRLFQASGIDALWRRVETKSKVAPVAPCG